MRGVLKSYGYGNVQSNLSKSDLLGIKIPLPPKEIQLIIVKACEAIDLARESAQVTIDKAKEEIEISFNDANSKSNKTLKLSNSDIFDISIGKRVLTKEIEQTKKGIPVYSANVFEPIGLIDKELLKCFDKPSVIWGIDGDWMVNFIDKNIEFYPTDHCGVIRVNGEEVHPRYLTWLLDKAGQVVSFSRNHRASIDRIKGLSVKVPKIDIQKELVSKVEKLEQEINEARETLEKAPQKKQEVLDKYLK